MVVKLNKSQIIISIRFESSVISYGSQTAATIYCHHHSFESSVISYGSQTLLI